MNPLNLPVGSVRAILAILIVAGTMAIYSFFGGVPNEMWMAVGMVVQGYFAARSNEGKNP